MGRIAWVDKVLQHTAKTFPARYSEWILAIILLSWGVVLAKPFDTFALSPTYVGLARIAPEHVWAIGCAIVGTARLIALAVNGLWVPSTFHLRALTSFVSIFFWFQITLGLLATGSNSTAIAVYPWLLLLDVICLYRVARDSALFHSMRAEVRGARL